MHDDAIPADAARLQVFAGDWDVSGTFEADGTLASISGRWRYERAADGWGLRGRLQTTIDIALGPSKDGSLTTP